MVAGEALAECSASDLDTAKYPRITFVSKTGCENKQRFRFEWRLDSSWCDKAGDVHARKLSEAIKDPWGKMRAGTIALTTIDRQEFGVSFNQKLNKGEAMVGNQVNIELEIELVQ